MYRVRFDFELGLYDTIESTYLNAEVKTCTETVEEF